MSYQNLEPFSKQVTILIGLAVVGFMSFGLALSYYRNVLFDRTLEGIEEQNDEIKEIISDSNKDLEYFSSSQYKDKYAKENLGLINPGEKVLIIKGQNEARLDNEVLSKAQEEQREVAFLELLRQMPVVEHWKLYLFERDKLKELKSSKL